MGVQEIEAFLTHLAKDENGSASTQNQALNALLFLYRNILQMDLSAPIHTLRAKHAQHLPTVLSKTEVNQVLIGMQGLHPLDVKTTMIYTHVLNRGAKAARSPLDE